MLVVHIHCVLTSLWWFLLICFGILCLCLDFFFFFFNDTATTEIYTLSLHDALPIYSLKDVGNSEYDAVLVDDVQPMELPRSEEHTSELQSLTNLVCRLLLEKKKN